MAILNSYKMAELRDSLIMHKIIQGVKDKHILREYRQTEILL